MKRYELFWINIHDLHTCTNAIVIEDTVHTYLVYIFKCQSHYFQKLPRDVTMGAFGWLVDGPLMKAEWRSASTECGGQCVIMDGIPMRPELCADSWDFLSIYLGQVST